MILDFVRGGGFCPGGIMSWIRAATTNTSLHCQCREMAPVNPYSAEPVPYDCARARARVCVCVREKTLPLINPFSYRLQQFAF